MDVKQDRLYLLDLARAFAAITVVLQHYQHFYIYKYNGVSEVFDKSTQPFFNLIGFAYNFGSQAVPFFFMLSGFIFFSYYYKKILYRKINFKNFIILRLSRLYPLHFLTLMLTAFFQLIYFKYDNSYFIFEENNIRNFFQHVFLIQEWPFIGNSNSAFNAPSFSISVEIFLYISFFFISLNYAKNLKQTLIITLIALITYSLIRSTLALGLLLFFLGGVLYYLLMKIKENLITKRILVIAILLIINLIVFSRSLNYPFLILQFELAPFIGDRLMILLYFIKFPLVIINLCVIQFFFKNIGKKFQILGDISYTVYLMHFPIQIIFHLINLRFFKISYDQNMLFILFMFLVILFSYITYKYFELPFKNQVRKKFIKQQLV